MALPSEWALMTFKKTNFHALELWDHFFPPHAEVQNPINDLLSAHVCAHIQAHTHT